MIPKAIRSLFQQHLLILPLTVILCAACTQHNEEDTVITGALSTTPIRFAVAEYATGDTPPAATGYFHFWQEDITDGSLRLFYLFNQTLEDIRAYTEQPYNTQHYYPLDARNVRGDGYATLHQHDYTVTSEQTSTPTEITPSVPEKYQDFFLTEEADGYEGVDARNSNGFYCYLYSDEESGTPIDNRNWGRVYITQPLSGNLQNPFGQADRNFSFTPATTRLVLQMWKSQHTAGSSGNVQISDIHIQVLTARIPAFLHWTPHNGFQAVGDEADPTAMTELYTYENYLEPENTADTEGGYKTPAYPLYLCLDGLSLRTDGDTNPLVLRIEATYGTEVKQFDVTVQPETDVLTGTQHYEPGQSYNLNLIFDADALTLNATFSSWTEAGKGFINIPVDTTDREEKDETTEDNEEA